MADEKVAYREGGVEFEGQLIRPDGGGAAPVVVVAHAWAGQSDLERRRARELSELGYAGFALDVYGRGVLGKDKEENAALMAPLMEDRALLARRLLAGIEAARACPGVDRDRVAAIGYCFGGLCVLDLARRGAKLRGVVSFHGLLGAPEGLEPAPIAAKVLALHGHDDPMAPPEQVLAFEEEMTARGADWQLHAYGATMHAFTNPAANDPDFGTVHQPRAERRAWASMRRFLEEIFEEPSA